MVAGRTTEPRDVTVTTTATSTAITAPSGTFNEEDAGREITAAGIPADTTLASVESDTAATLSQAATAGATVTATLSGDSEWSYGFKGWSPESDAESESYTVAANNAGVVPPDRITDTSTAVSQRTRS